VEDRETSKQGGGFRPPHLIKDIDELNDWLFDTINNGVYRIGFATSQQVYNENVWKLFNGLDRVEAFLGEPEHTPYLFGNSITEPDVRLFTTIIRFDCAYYTIFKCNIKMIRHDYPNLHAWVRRLYWDVSETTKGGAFMKTTNFDVVSTDSYFCFALGLLY
jgi:putative glutathione S-transferase